MNESIAHVAHQIKEAREAKGLSQRALSKKVGIPQGHLSRIESGAVNLQLSSLIELARVLELELMLVPKKAQKATDVIVKETNRTNNFQMALRMVAKLERVTEFDSDSQVLETLKKAENVIENLNNDHSAQMKIAEAVKHLPSINDIISKNPAIFKKMQELTDIRNRLAHLPTLKNVAKYQLDDED